ncbi:MAG: SUMF1/EgtB/PvdO family nonheme iron enzyme [Desulfobulbaceae bacterium]|nr:SUMF1/EgtB/PvdO family nonheme iron enzyme [Desulfobulbaceae bacterium]
MLACLAGTAFAAEPAASPAVQAAGKTSEKGIVDYLPAAAVIGALSLFFGIFQYRKRNIDAGKKKIAETEAVEKHEDRKKSGQALSNEERYRERLKQELGKSTIFGMPGVKGDSESVDLMQTFVELDLDEAERVMENAFERDRVQRLKVEPSFETPDSALVKAVDGKMRMLLIIGEPGAGKTTIIKHYTLNNQLILRGFSKPVKISYLPLSAMKPGEEAKGLHQKLSEQFQPHLNIEAAWFDQRLKQEKTLVLLDGLDEIGDKEQRVAVCRWISNAAKTWPEAFFVLTSRDKGYAAEERNALLLDKRSAYVKRFNERQQREFLEKWFKAALSRNSEISEHKRLATEKVQALIDYLARPDHKGLKELAGIPLMLQLMALLWKESGTLPRRREELYRIALDYLLYYRESEKQQEPILPAEESRKVLAPVSLWIQEREPREETVEKDAFHLQMQGVIDHLSFPHRNHTAKKICENMVERISVLDAAGSKYQFRHKTFREYLAALEILGTRENSDADERLKRLAGFVGDPWWDEPLLFFIAQANTGLFEKFIRAFFEVEQSAALDEQPLTFLKRLVKVAPVQTVTPFRELLADSSMTPNRQSYLLDCLKTIGSRQAVEVAQEFVTRNPNAGRELLRKAGEVVELLFETSDISKKSLAIVQSLTDVFQSTVEPGAQYILIPGGSYVYSATKKEVQIQDMYFAKYPVTNRLYRTFIDYLRSEAPEYEALYPLSGFSQILQNIASEKIWNNGFSDWLKEGNGDLVERFRSEHDDDRRFGGDDQPVLSITWYAARSYCLWLSLMESKGTRTDIYRLPMESEWEWAAAGKKKRKYPWGNTEPTPKLANYNKSNIGATTPVGSYQEGATPEGLYDMAGNVWEWQENLYGNEKYPDARALRGGSWDNNSVYLSCFFRLNALPDFRVGYYFGFRVIRPSLLL